jgi:holo-[acyl-carrier protein] synthase
MVLGIGVDLVEISRIATLLADHPDRAPRRLFSETERMDCEKRARPEECLAARFAVKEAFWKAVGTGLSGPVTWHDVSIRVENGGRPVLETRGGATTRLAELGAKATHVSISHEAGFAIAVVMIEG